MTISRTAARIALVGIAALSFAACSSNNASLKSDAKKLKNEVRAAATKAEKNAEKDAAKAAETTTTTAAPQPTAPATPACPTATEAAAILGAGTNAFTVPICEGGFATGRASNQVDFGYLLQATGGSWARASDSVENEVCTTNPQGVSQAMVGAACID